MSLTLSISLPFSLGFLSQKPSFKRLFLVIFTFFHFFFMGFTTLASTALLVAPKAIKTVQNYQNSKNTALSLKHQSEALETNAQQTLALAEAQLRSKRQDVQNTLAKQESARSLDNIAPQSGSAFYAKKGLAEELEEQLELGAGQALAKAREQEIQAQLKQSQANSIRSQAKTQFLADSFAQAANFTHPLLSRAGENKESSQTDELL